MANTGYIWYLAFVSSLRMTKVKSLRTDEAPVLEYCPGDTFSPSCEDNEVIIISQSRYGRMQLGRCIISDEMYLNCFTDALSWMDRQCSGLKSCSISVPNQELTNHLTCSLPVDHSPYLEVSSTCLQVVQVNPIQCSYDYHVEATHAPKYLSSDITRRFGCGLDEAPWYLTAQIGQKISISLVDFFWEKKENNTEGCIEYGSIRDRMASKLHTICGGLQRNREMQLSQGSVVFIKLKKVMVEEYRFLLRIQAVGCARYEPPRFSWTLTKENYVIVGCNGVTWTVTCNGTHWLGHVGTCDVDILPQSPTLEAEEDSEVMKPRGVILPIIGPVLTTCLLLVIILAIIGSLMAVGCFVAVATLLIFCIIRKRGQLATDDSIHLQTAPWKQQSQTLDRQSYSTPQVSYKPVSVS